MPKNKTSTPKKVDDTQLAVGSEVMKVIGGVRKYGWRGTIVTINETTATVLWVGDKTSTYESIDNIRPYKKLPYGER